MSALLLGRLEEFFGWLLTASWQASVLALLVLGVQWALGARLNPRWRYALWLLVLVRLLLPVQVESALSLFQFAPAPSPAFTAPMTQPLFSPAPALSVPLPAPSGADVSPPISFSPYSVLALGWLLGAVVLGGLTFEVNRRFARHVAASPEVTDPAIRDLFASARAELHTRRTVRLVESAQVGSPAIMGLFRPTLLLPVRVRETFDLAELRLIFLHELAHIKRGDVLAQMLIALLQIVHWFNPVLWYAFRRMRADREPAADALVLSRAGEAEKERYGLMLLKLLEHFQQRHALPTLVGILEDKDRFKRRFQLIARFTRGAYGWSVLGVLLISVLSIACLTTSKATVPAVAVKISSGSNKVAGLIQVDAKVVQIGEDDYQAHCGEIDAAVQKGDSALLSHLRSFNMLAESKALIQSGEECVMERVRVFPYPIAWDPPETVSSKKYPPTIIPATPTDFKRQNLGVRFVATPILGADKISFTGDLKVSSLEGWSQGKYNTPQAHFHVRHLALSESFVSGQTKGFQVPGGAQMEPFDPTVAYFPDQVPGNAQKSKTLARLFLFLNISAAHVTPNSTNSPPAEKKIQPIIDAVKKDDAAALAKLVDGLDAEKICDGDEPLLFDARSPEVVKILLEHGADANARNKSGLCILNFACLNAGKNAASIARILLDHGAEVNARSESMGETPLFDACDESTADLLLDHGADATATSANGDTVYVWAGRNDVSLLDALARHKLLDVRRDGPTVMLHAALAGNLPVIKNLLARGVDPQWPGIMYHSAGKPTLMKPLVGAVVSGRTDAVRLLVAHGARDGDWNPLVVALRDGYPNIVKVLWDGDVHTVSPLFYAISQGASDGDIEKLLREGSPADPPQDRILTPLGAAAFLGNMDVMKLLLARGANVNKGGIFDPKFPIYRMTPLVMAALEGRDEIATYLLRQGATPSSGALWAATSNSDPDPRGLTTHFEKTVRLLLDRGALKNATLEEQGCILAASVQTSQGHSNAIVLKMLLDTGANPDAPMPSIVEEGDQPNTVIGYFRAYYAKYKDDKEKANRAQEIKPLLDMLEKAAAGMKPASSTIHGTVTDPDGKPTAGAEVGGGGDKAQPIIDAVKKDDAATLAKPLEATSEKLHQETDSSSLRGMSELLADAGASPPAKGPGVMITGRLAVQFNPEIIDFVESKGRLLSPTGGGYNFSFRPDGSFVVPHVQSDVYNRTVKLLRKVSVVGSVQSMNESSVQLLSPVTITAAPRQEMNMSVANPFNKQIPKGAVQIQFMLAEINDEDYQANRKEIDAALAAGGREITHLLYLLKGVDLISAPLVATQLNQTAHFDITREFPYPTSFATDKSGKVTPKNFKTADIGLTADIIPTKQNGQILLNGGLRLVDFDGFAPSNVGARVPTLRTVETRVVEAVPVDGELKAVWIPGGRLDEETITDKDGSGKTSVTHRNVKKRLLLLMGAKLQE